MDIIILLMVVYLVLSTTLVSLCLVLLHKIRQAQVKIDKLLETKAKED